jgi:hypothetical protein
MEGEVMETTRTDVAGRDVVASFPTYSQAQQAVQDLTTSDYPVEGVTIVGADMRMVETVTGRMTTGRAALAGAASGAWIGLLIGLIISLATPYILGAVLWGVFWGAIFGAILGAVSQLIWRGTRDFASTSRLVAARYDVMAPSEQLLRAQQILETARSHHART